MVQILMILLLTFSFCSHLANGAEQERTEQEILKEPKENCSLNNHAVFPWVVKIWDINKNMTAMHGAILGYTGVLTTCDKNLRIEQATTYEVIGQRILSTKPPGTYENTCSQKANSVKIIPHPSCIEVNSEGKRKCQTQASNVFCFVIMVLAAPFHVVRNDNPATAYPTFYFPKTAVALLILVKYVNTQTESGCRLPHFYERFIKKPALFYSSFLNDMKSIPYHSECMPMNCEHEEKSDFPLSTWRRRRHIRRRDIVYNADAATQAECVAVHRNKTRHGLRICLYPPWTPRIEPFDVKGVKGTNFYGGATITCSGVVYGMVRPGKGHMHRVADDHFRQDYFVITTFLRIFPWLVQMKDHFTAPWIVTKFTDELGMYKEHIDEVEKPEGPPPDLDPSKVRSFSVQPRVRFLILHFQLLLLSILIH